MPVTARAKLINFPPTIVAAYVKPAALKNSLTSFQALILRERHTVAGADANDATGQHAHERNLQHVPSSPATGKLCRHTKDLVAQLDAGAPQRPFADDRWPIPIGQ